MTPVTQPDVSLTGCKRHAFTHSLPRSRGRNQRLVRRMARQPAGGEHVVTAGDATPGPDTAYHWQADDASAALGSNAQRGLTDDEARAGLGRYGRNELTAEIPAPRWRRLLAQFQNVLVILLLVATAISAGLWAFERDAALPYEAIAILAVVLLNATMGYVQESHAEAAVAALRVMSSAHASVVRDGERQSIDTA